MEDASERKLIQLEPFAHQVGGHSSMLCLDGATVAKPLVTREQRFYETLPASLRPFVPSFHGALEVHVIQGEGGYVTHAASPPPLYRPHLGLRTRRSRIRLHDSGDIEIEGENEGMVFEDEDEEREQLAAKSKEEDFSQLEEEEMRKLNRGPRPSVGHALNPWVLRCHRESLSGLTPGTSQNFILLENLTARFKQPCVLDLKVGTRQYGDSASPAKVRSKMMKVATTTSGKLGLRLGGMQVYQVTTRRFLCRNKLFGRALSVEGFRTALVQFLHNGWYIRLDVVRPLLERLETLEGILTRLGAARFYTCSLLCLYEGELRTPSTTPLSPSTPAPPITPGPFSSMPPGSFSATSNRFIFPSIPQAIAELHSFTSTFAGKPVSNGSEKPGFDSEMVKSSILPTGGPQTFPKLLGNTTNISSTSAPVPSIRQDPGMNLSKPATSGKISSNGTTIQQSSDPQICKSPTYLNSITTGCRKDSSASTLPSVENFDRLSLVDQTPFLTFCSQGKGIQEASTSHSSIPTNNSTLSPSSSQQYSSTKSASTEDGTSSENIKLNLSLRQKQYSIPLPSSVIPLHSEETQTVDNIASCQNSKPVKGSCISQPLHLSTIKAKAAVIEEQVTKPERKPSRRSNETVGRSVSADSVSYVRVATTLRIAETKVAVPPMVKKVSSTEVTVNGYAKGEKEDWISEHGEGRKKRSHSLEHQISLHTSTTNQNSFVEDGTVSCYTPVSASPLVDVRLIDFAHSTHRGLADPVTYAGPDQGFLFGLHNLINLLRDIAHETMTATERC